MEQPIIPNSDEAIAATIGCSVEDLPRLRQQTGQTTLRPDDRVEVKSYKRKGRKVHRGGRPKNDEAKCNRVKFTTTLPFNVRDELRQMSADYACPVSDVISILLLSHKTKESFDDLVSLGSGDVDRKETIRQQRMALDLTLEQIGQAELEEEG